MIMLTREQLLRFIEVKGMLDKLGISMQQFAEEFNGYWSNVFKVLTEYFEGSNCKGLYSTLGYYEKNEALGAYDDIKSGKIWAKNHSDGTCY